VLHLREASTYKYLSAAVAEGSSAEQDFDDAAEFGNIKEVGTMTWCCIQSALILHTTLLGFTYKNYILSYMYLSAAVAEGSSAEQDFDDAAEFGNIKEVGTMTWCCILHTKVMCQSTCPRRWLKRFSCARSKPCRYTR
jgi:hypothetical protein